MKPTREEIIPPRFARQAERAPTDPETAIRVKCLDCSNWNTEEAGNCHLTDCPLWTHRSRNIAPEAATDYPTDRIPSSFRRAFALARYTVSAAIKAKWLECTAFEPKAIRECNPYLCALHPHWPFRAEKPVRKLTTARARFTPAATGHRPRGDLDLMCFRHEQNQGLTDRAFSGNACLKAERNRP